MRVLRCANVSVRVNFRLISVTVLALALVATLIVLQLISGDYPLSIRDVVSVLGGGGSSIERTLVLDVRAGRAFVACVVGAALGFAGALTQSVARNPLASPDTLGITQGAACAVVLAIAGAGTFLPAGLSEMLASLGLPLVAIVGSLASGAALWWLAGSRRDSPVPLVLIGVGCAILLQAVSTWALVATNIDQAASARLWLAGSLNGRTWEQGMPVCVAIVIACALSGWLSFNLSALSLGTNLSQSLGLNIKQAQLAQLVVAVILTALAVSAAGPIGFVAFVVPQIARVIGGTPLPPLVLSLVLGAALLLGADYVAAILLPRELPVGIVTAFCGAPVLLTLAFVANRRAQ